ncbi:hypothetical protein AXG93_1193s1290 [Marchantia polymorpha subsp. ruderalis]|uniref:Uncharacterized protein n=1 Tax=Marchantia polymorpha subsp. ruderalis TaxID=1480154 RepID=A0A176WKZ8_MARPO|nr:hypothetical protein AXG93_1193s1290 [Marchantia polymorpha subsp. ruderalis]
MSLRAENGTFFVEEYDCCASEYKGPILDVELKYNASAPVRIRRSMDCLGEDEASEYGEKLRKGILLMKALTADEPRSFAQQARLQSGYATGFFVTGSEGFDRPSPHQARTLTQDQWGLTRVPMHDGLLMTVLILSLRTMGSNNRPLSLSLPLIATLAAGSQGVKILTKYAHTRRSEGSQKDTIAKSMSLGKSVWEWLEPKLILKHKNKEAVPFVQEPTVLRL